MNKTIILPTPIQRVGNNRQEMLGGQDGYPDSANTFSARNFVALTSGVLSAVATGGVLAFGLVLDASKLTTLIEVPYAMFGDRHYPLNLTDMIFAISVTDATGNIGEVNGAPILSEITVGTSYGILLQASGAYAGRHFLNVDETSNTLFTVVEKPTSWNGVAQNAATFNPTVLVRVIASKIQSGA